MVDGAPTVTIRAARSKVQLGESFHVIVSAVHRPEVAITLPQALPLGDAFGELGRQEASEPQPGGLHRTVFDLTLVGFTVGSQTVAPIPVTYVVGGIEGQVVTESLAVEVVSIVGDGKEELRPIAPPVSVRQRDWTLLWILAGVVGTLLVAVLGWALARAWARRLERTASPREAVDDRPPDEIALEKLRMLVGSGQLEADDRRPLYFTVTEIIREYLGRRYAFDALELTTSELLVALARQVGVPLAEVGSWLKECDLVKYAGVAVARAEAVSVLETAVAIVERTRVLAAERPPPAASADPPPADGTPEAIGGGHG